MKFAFLPKYCKWPGLALVASGFILNSVCEPNYDSVKDGIGLLVQVLIFTGLLTVICSKEKAEDEFIDHYRLISLQWAVITLIALRLGWKAVGFITSDESWMPKWQVNSLLFFYLIQFYYHCYVREWFSRILKRVHEK
jgi:hypothetical protein